MFNGHQNKIAFIATVYRHLEAFHIPFMSLFQQKGYEVHAYAHLDAGKLSLEKQNIICHDIPFSRSPFHFQNLIALKKLVESFQQERFRMVHVHTPVGSILGRIAARFVGIPCVIYTAHGFHFFKGAPIHYWMIFYPIERFMARWTDYLITINQEDFLRARSFSIRKDVLFVNGVGVDLSDYDSVNKLNIRLQKRRELSISDHEFIILCVAELIPRKNQIQLIRAIELLNQKDIDVVCLIVGSGKNERALKEYVVNHKLESNIKFLGFRRDVPELLYASDVVALLSIHEGLTKALMEAMAAGKPIVATNVRGNRDLVHHGENGFLVPVHDVQATAQALHTLMQDAALRKRMGYKSRELSRSYDLSLIFKQMEEIYDRALSD